MNLYTAEQIRAWDAFTIANEPIASIDLMERAAARCVDWLLRNMRSGLRYLVCCGKGNNGGDGLAIARMLYLRGIPVEVYILEFGKMGSADFQENLRRLHNYPIPYHFIQDETGFPKTAEEDIIIDALFGTGLTRPLEGLAAALVHHLNNSGRKIVAVDVPSGMQLETSSAGHAVIKAGHTLSFQATKAAFLLPEHEPFVGEVAVLDIGLHPNYVADAPYRLLDAAFVQALYRPRSRFGHKGTYGHVLLMGGSYGKMGAMVLAAKAALRTGAGLVSLYVPACGYNTLQTAVPEAMTITDTSERLIAAGPPEPERYDVLGIGPGMGTAPATQVAMKQVLEKATHPLVIDADGLNCLAQQPELLHLVPKGSILTPHPKEFERLFGPTASDFEKLHLAQSKARAWDIVIVLKGHYSFIAVPDGLGFFNSSGNPGMATGGSGDVLTGMLAALLAQGYSSKEAAILGVYLHGLAGDLAAAAHSQEAMTAGDIPGYLGAAFRTLSVA